MHPADLSDATIVGAVLALRLVVPLFILRFPLPALLASMAIDGVDGGIFSSWTGLDMSWYQSYDKALDIYYLAIAYLAVRRNWPGRFPVALIAGLWYYRLVGVLAFELTGHRWLLLVFPNTFEYAVIALEIARTRWSPVRLTRRALLWTVALIWVVIKLPQEWWIHVAQLDFTDEFARVVLGVQPGSGLAAGLANRPWVGVLLVALVLALAVLARWVWPRLPAPDWGFTVRADDVAARIGWVPVLPAASRLGTAAILEKLVLTGLVSVILFEVYPAATAPVGRVFLVVALVVLANAALGLPRRFSGSRAPATPVREGRPVPASPGPADLDEAPAAGHGPASPFSAVWLLAVGSFVVNAAALVLFADLVGGRRGVLTWVDVAFFGYLITLVVVLFDASTLRRAVRAGSVHVRSDLPTPA